MNDRNTLLFKMGVWANIFSIFINTYVENWVSVAPPTFTQDREFLENIIPNNI